MIHLNDKINENDFRKKKELDYLNEKYEKAKRYYNLKRKS